MSCAYVYAISSTNYRDPPVMQDLQDQVEIQVVRDLQEIGDHRVATAHQEPQ